MNKIPVGYTAICEKLALKQLPHYRESYVAAQGRGKIIIDNHHEIHIYAKSYLPRNPDNLLENLEFALKYDGINLAIIKNLFSQLEKQTIIQHIQNQPTGAYNRKIWFLYEFLMEEQLPIKDSHRMNYVNLLNPETYFTSSGIKSPRHGIINNLLGNKYYCPFVRKTSKILHYIDQTLNLAAQKLISKYDEHLIKRACNYLYTKETMSSYQIEHEAPDKTRINRFIQLLQKAPTIEKIDKNLLISLQNNIVDPRFQDTDYRQTQNYVGENIDFTYQKIHYISPKPENVSILMEGLLSTLNVMTAANIHPVIIAAIIAFGFVFIHPFEDGNGRIHRFLIHHILSKNHFTPNNIILPISYVMLLNMRAYDDALESFSIPLLSLITDYSLDDDGIMLVNQNTLQYYQYNDFTALVEYLFSCIQDAINNHLEREIKHLIHYDRAKSAIQQIVDMPDNQINLIIKLLTQNNGTLSESKRNRFFSKITDDEMRRIKEAVIACLLQE